MGNQCTTRAYLQARSDTKDLTKTQFKNQRKSSCQIVLAPQIPVIARDILHSVRNPKSSLEKNEMSKSHIKKAKSQRNCYFADQDVDFSPTKGDILQIIETQSTLLEAKNQDVMSSRTENVSDASHLNKSRITVNIVSPSQMEQSMESCWNKSNFNQSRFFQKITYDQIFSETAALQPSPKK